MHIDGLVIAKHNNDYVIEQFLTGYKYLVPKEKLLFEKDRDGKALKRRGKFSVRVENVEQGSNAKKLHRANDEKKGTIRIDGNIYYVN